MEEGKNRFKEMREAKSHEAKCQLSTINVYENCMITLVNIIYIYISKHIIK